MQKITYFTRLALCSAGLFLSSVNTHAGEKKLMHCFAFTAVESATDADWKAFYKATDQIPKKIHGVSKVWYGKLGQPINIGGQTRQYGVCMEMADMDTLRAYTNDPYHKEWVGIYSKVRVEGTTTYDILGQ